MSRGRRSGSALGTVLLLLSVGLLISFTAASLGVFNAQLSTAQEAHDHAKNLAESAVARALAELAKREDFGADRAAGKAIVVTVPGLPTNWKGFLSFNPTEASGQSTGYSSNYFNRDTHQMGSLNRDVPPNTIHLVGLGVCGTTRCQVECLYYKPPYPYGLGSSGLIEAENVLVAGIKSGAPFSGNYAGLPANQKTPAHVFSNRASSGPGDASLRLGPGCDIRGNAGAVGNVTVAGDSTVEGEVQPYTYKRPIPEINIDAIYNQIATAAGDWTFSGAGQAPVRGGGNGTSSPFTGYMVLSGDQAFSGNLNMSGCALFVDGDLDVGGTVRGTGIILSRGDIRLHSGAAFDATESLALCAKGDIHLTAANRDSYFFHGLVYSEGDIYANGITVLGSVVANSRGNRAKGNLHLRDMSIHPGGGVGVFSVIGKPFNPLYLNTGVSNNSGGNTDEDNDAVTVRVDGYIDSAGRQKYNAYVWYAPDEDFLEQGGRNGYEANGWILGDITRPFVISNVDRANLEKQLNIVMHRCNWDNEAGPSAGPLPTYLFAPNPSDPPTVIGGGVPDYPAPHFNLVNTRVQDAVVKQINDATQGTGPVISVDLNRVTPATEKPRVLLYRQLP